MAIGQMQEMTSSEILLTSRPLRSHGVAEARKLTAQHNDLVLGYAGLVRHIAYRLFRRRTYVDVDDLIQAGMAALSEAVDQYGCVKMGSFEGYASIGIRAAMLDFVRNSDWSTRRSRGSAGQRHDF
jgi:RNA polymerase sigma factor (sigma-70 family)